MLLKFARESYTIEAGKAVSCKVRRAQTIQIITGRVWLTVEGQLADYWLKPGEQFTLPAGRLIVIQADNSANQPSQIKLLQQATWQFPRWNLAARHKAKPLTTCQA